MTVWQLALLSLVVSAAAAGGGAYVGARFAARTLTGLLMDTNSTTQQKLDTLKSDLEGVKQAVAGLPAFIQSKVDAARSAQAAGDDQAVNDQLDALDAGARELAANLAALQSVTGTTTADATSSSSSSSSSSSTPAAPTA